MKACTKTVLGLYEFQESQYKEMEALGFSVDRGKPIIRPEDLPKGILTEEQQASAETVFFTYADACLTPLGMVIDPKADTTTASSKFLRLSSAPGSVEAVENSIGLLATGSEGDPCSGVIVDMGGQPHLVAAAHCLGHEEGRDDGSAVFGSVWPSLEFTSYAGQSISVSVAPEISTVTYNPQREDIFAVRLEAPVEGPFIEVATYPLSAWEPMLIVGRSAYLEARAKLDELTGTDLVQASISIEAGADCNARTSDRGEMLYGCQTEKGMSGAPILAWREGRYVLAGLHLGAIDGPPQPISCTSGKGEGGTNRGISLRWP